MNDVIRDVKIYGSHSLPRIEFTYQRPNDWDTPGRDPYYEQESVTIELTRMRTRRELNHEVIYKSKRKYNSKEEQVKDEQMKEELKKEILGLIFPQGTETIFEAIDAYYNN